MKKYILICLLCTPFFAHQSWAQMTLPKNEMYQKDWHLLDTEQDSVRGISLYRAYKEIVKNKKGKSIIVAFIDSGCDPECKALKSRLWVNKGEIPGNGIDDDQNGYIDDIHGWNFLGSKNGEQVIIAAKDATRKYFELRPYFETADLLNHKIDSVALADFTELQRNFYNSQNYLLKEIYDCEKKLQALESGKETGKEVEAKKQSLEAKMDHAKKSFCIQYNEREIIGDDPNLIIERGYGNSNVFAEGSRHGNCVAGCTGALPHPENAVRGIAQDVELMIIRAVAPTGTEYDKDIVNAVRYAVDNGAKIINMSFGALIGVSTQKYVQEAFDYAAQKGVLIVHAAGNNSTDTDLQIHYPENPQNPNTRASFLVVGNSGTNLSARHKRGFLVSGTSNYGQTTVDLFAPGMFIYCASVGDEYIQISGTSFSSPIACGVAALVWSQHPNLTAPQIKEILMKSVTKVDETVKCRVGREMLERHFSTMSVSGGIINAYQALKLAKEYDKKNKR